MGRSPGRPHAERRTCTPRRAARGSDPGRILGVLARAHRVGAIATKADLAVALHDVLEVGLWVDTSVAEPFWALMGGK